MTFIEALSASCERRTDAGRKLLTLSASIYAMDAEGEQERTGRDCDVLPMAEAIRWAFESRTLAGERKGWRLILSYPNGIARVSGLCVTNDEFAGEQEERLVCFGRLTASTAARIARAVKAYAAKH
jgi:hypothetical protein